MKNSKKAFLKRPEYPGGKEAFREYLKNNLKYPEEAKQKRIEGIVHLSAKIDDNGNVSEVSVQKGIGGGCDEEAVRLIENLQFGSVKNRGVRLKTQKKFRIEFKLPRQKRVAYSFVSTNRDGKKEDKKDKTPQQRKYTYTVFPNQT